ncbi:MAG: DNA mismatch repair endonuclease MutL [Flavobacteriales bacterium]|nr:DNA mismatch repair endonuclease MutL [Flavobacteriales bacterium]
MSDIIQLLPDSVANQIAAGEVVQRPASAVKELLENAIDAKASEVSLVVKNAGKTLIRVIDNGTGMSQTDARLCLERHATSKIKTADDLFSLNTMGFRGEAVPSIAAISQMEIKTKPENEDLGSHLILEGSEVKSQEFCQTSKGTIISVKNLFFNVPARRNFLKSNPIETKHIIEEFLRVALIHPEVAMNMDNDSNEVYRLPTGTFRQRIVNIFGNKYNQRLVPVEETTDIVKLSGFVGKPEFAKKTRGEQYFFVNRRFIKSPYLNHAIQKAYEELLPSDQFPSYFIKLEIDPSKIDINIHPTKTEVKFEEERAIYAIIRTAVRQALGKYNIAPTIDFEQENSFNVPALKKGESIQMPNIQVDPNFNPFESIQKPRQASVKFPFHRDDKPLVNWEKLYQNQEASKEENTFQSQANSKRIEQEISDRKVIQLHRKYILSHIKSGFIIIDQQRAHERVLIEKLSTNLASSNLNSQQLLFPEEVEFSTEDFELLHSLLDEIRALGFDLNQFGKNAFIVNGIPSGTEENARYLLESMLEEFKQNLSELKNKPKINLINSLAKGMSLKPGKNLKEIEMQNLIDELFACEMPYHLPNGKPIIINYSIEDLDKKFKKG